MAEIIICSDFFESFSKLPASIQNKVRYFFDKFSENHLMNGFNYEMLNKKVGDKQLYSARINQEYRTIIYEDKKENKFYILWVDKHDDAYNWANSRTKLNLKDSNILVISKDEYLQKGLHTNKDSNLFSRISNRDLLKLGVTEAELERIRSIPDMKTLESYQNTFSSEVYSNLEWIANGLHVRDVLEYQKYQKEEILDYIYEKVLSKALSCKELDQDIKDSVQNTYERLKRKESVKEIMDFFEDALLANRGRTIHDTFQKLGLQGFEEIADDVRKLYKG